MLKSRFKILIAFAVVAFSTTLALAQSPISVKWIMGTNNATPGTFSARFVIINNSSETLGNNWELLFNQLHRTINLPENSPVRFSVIVPNYYCLTPSANYKPLMGGDSLVVEYTQRGSYTSISFTPDGGHFVMLDNPSKIYPVSIKPQLMNNPEQWVAKKGQPANYPDGKFMYERNQTINPADKAAASSPYDIFPTPKSIVLGKSSVKIPASVAITGKNAQLAVNYLKEKMEDLGITENVKSSFTITASEKKFPGKNDEYYTLNVTSRGATIQGNTATAALNGAKTLVAAIRRSGSSRTLPLASITDYPDLSYRGMMLDVARNYTTLENLMDYIDILAAYKINKFQFHFNDDEAWRLEIPGIPELTAVGSRKGYTHDEKNFLVQTYAGNGNPDDLSTSANGYISADQFVEFLKYANARGVEIIPEIETPGHARAAIISLKRRYEKLQATNPEEANRYRVWDDDDQSKYASVQGYTDNVLNLAEPGTYRFLQKVIDELSDMYVRAGLKLNTVHLGGDEVAHGAWEGSPTVKAFLQQNNMTGTHQLVEHYLDQITEYMISKGIKAAGWQEVAVKHSAEFNAKIAPRFSAVTVWSTVGRNDSIPYHVANAGYPTILSNVDNFYLDLMYSRHQCEPGLNWGGNIDEFCTWWTLPFNSYRSARYDINGNERDIIMASVGKPSLQKKENLKGVQAQLWSETIRDYDMVQYYTFPKIIGLVERGWNASPAWSNDISDIDAFNKAMSAFNLKIGLQELPVLAANKVNFHIGQPGIDVRDNMLYVNTQYPGETVYYTLDGTEPTANSPIWKTSVDVTGVKLIKAKSFYLGKESVTTYLFR